MHTAGAFSKNFGVGPTAERRPGKVTYCSVANRVVGLCNGGCDANGKVGDDDEQVGSNLNFGAEDLIGHPQIQLAEVVHTQREEVHGHGGRAENHDEAVEVAGLYTPDGPGSHRGALRRSERPREHGQRLQDVPETHPKNQPAVGRCQGRPIDHQHDDRRGAERER